MKQVYTVIHGQKNIKLGLYLPLVIHIHIARYRYRVAHEKLASRLIDQHGRRSRTLYRKLNKCKCKVLTGWRRC